MKCRQCVAGSGPYRYEHIAEALSQYVSIVPVPAGEPLGEGWFLRHILSESHGGIGCCHPFSRLQGEGCRVFKPSATGAPEPSLVSFEESDVSSGFILKLVGPGVQVPHGGGGKLMRRIAGGSDDDEFEEHKASFTGTFEQLCASEVTQFVVNLDSMRSPNGVETDESQWQCPFCVFRTFATKRQLQQHCNSQHANPLNAYRERSNKGHGVVFGSPSTNQVKLMKLLWDRDEVDKSVRILLDMQIATPEGGEYLRRSAAVIRDDLMRSPSWDKSVVGKGRVSTHIDEHFCLLLDTKNTRYVWREDLGCAHQLGQSFWCTDEFLTAFYAMLMHSPNESGLRTYIDRLRDECGWLGPLLPASTGPLVLSVIEALVEHPASQRLATIVRQSTPKKIIEIDAQYSIPCRIVYQIPHGSSRANAEPDPEEIRVFITVRATGVVLTVTPKSSEHLPQQLAALEEVVSRNERLDVGMIYSDSPAVFDSSDLYGVFPKATIAKEPSKTSEIGVFQPGGCGTWSQPCRGNLQRAD